MDITTLLSIGSFVLILALLVLIRAKNTRFEVKPADIIVAVLPVIVFLLVTGKLQKFEIGEGGVKIEMAFVNATTSEISGQVTDLKGIPTDPMKIGQKGGVREIPLFIERKTEGLLFRIGHGGYYGDVIQQYLVRLTKEPFLNYLIIENPDGSFFGMADARKLAALFQKESPTFSANDLGNWLNYERREKLTRLPGFIPARNALGKKTDKGQALQKMEALNMDLLPVVDEKKRFAGIVDRSRLTASLLIDVAKNLKKK